MERLFGLSIGLLLLLLVGCKSVVVEKICLAFPEAKGAGKLASGGRGGKVIEVTNLNNSGHGSLRWALTRTEPRIVVFCVAGYIDLNTPIKIENGNLTIAGHSAPGDGICLRGAGIEILTDNVVMRYIRIRPGGELSSQSDAIFATGVDNVIIDHCSFSWATDEQCALFNNTNFTMQYCIISESLNNSTHPTLQQGSGAIWGGNNVTFHHNLFVHNKSRNPRIGYSDVDSAEISKIEIVNNVFFNWSGSCMYGGEGCASKIVNNMFIPGPSLQDGRTPVVLRPLRPYGRFYLAGNTIEGFEQLTSDNMKGVTFPNDLTTNLIDSFLNEIKVTEYTPSDTEDVLEEVLNTVGASLSRDEVDKRIVADVYRRSAAYGNKGIIDSQDEVGGWPQLLTDDKIDDFDHDGMFDEWEEINALDPTDATDAKNNDLDDCYSNVEVYLNELILGD